LYAKILQKREKTQVCLYASNIAACIGMNPYKKPHKALEEMWVLALAMMVVICLPLLGRRVHLACFLCLQVGEAVPAFILCRREEGRTRHEDQGLRAWRFLFAAARTHSHCSMLIAGRCATH